MSNIFEDTKKAFVLKSQAELRRAYLLFRMIQYPWLVWIGTWLTKIAFALRLPVQGLIRHTVFNHFCGGITEDDCLPVIDKLHAQGVSSVLDYSVEGQAAETEFDKALAKTLSIMEFAKEREAIPFTVFKPTAYGRLELYQKVGANQPLSLQEKEEWARIVDRYEQTCQRAHELDVLLLIDAEESWMQGAADDLATQMMERYNTEKAIIYNTLQCYRWDRVDYLKELHQHARETDFYLGFKIVRGAYMEKENLRAEQQSYLSPICASKKATDQTFDAAITYITEHIDDIALFAGTHNEASSLLLMKLMEEQGIAPDDPRVWFGQLYGMSDHISFNLASQGYNVAKYLPFGPVRDVIPYLIRRAEENTSVAGQSNRELDLLSREIKRRKKS